MHAERRLDLSPESRRELWYEVGEAIEDYMATVGSLPVAPRLDPAAVRSHVASLDFSHPALPDKAVEFVAAGLREYQVHTPHPRYFGLFNPASAAMGVAADALAAAFNPQLAAWSHNPFANEVESRLTREFGVLFGYDPSAVDGVFCSGGAEANHTALLCALRSRFAEAFDEGLAFAEERPVMYVSSEAHHSFVKAARMCGLGKTGLRVVQAGTDLKLDLAALRRQIDADRKEGFTPFLIVGTAGTTSAGMVDPLPELAEIARVERTWYHVDAAWGGGAAFVPEMRGLLAGIERSDSITFDAHKWLSVPMGAGLFLTRRASALRDTFATAQSYMPRDAEGLDVVDPFDKSMQWSRRAIGLKVFLSLAVAGWEGYATAIRRQTAMGELLRRELVSNQWAVVNDTPLPTLCFVDGRSPAGRDMQYLRSVCSAVVSSGRAWISTTQLRGSIPCLRACVTNFRTEPTDVLALVDALEDARRIVAAR